MKKKILSGLCLLLVLSFLQFNFAQACLYRVDASADKVAAENFLKGKQLYDQGDFLKAIEYFGKTGKIDSLFQISCDWEDECGPPVISIESPAALFGNFYIGKIHFENKDFLKAYYFFMHSCGFAFEGSDKRGDHYSYFWNSKKRLRMRHKRFLLDMLDVTPIKFVA